MAQRNSSVTIDPGACLAPPQARSRRKSDWGAVSALEALGRARITKEFSDEMEEMEQLQAALLRDEKSKHTCDLCGLWLGATASYVDRAAPPGNVVVSDRPDAAAETASPSASSPPTSRWYRCLSCDTIPIYCAVCIRKTHLPYDDDFASASVDARWIVHDIEALSQLDAAEMASVREERSRRILADAATFEETDELTILLETMELHETEERAALEDRIWRASEWALTLSGLAVGAANVIVAEEASARHRLWNEEIEPVLRHQYAKSAVVVATASAELWRLVSFGESEARDLVRQEEANNFSSLVAAHPCPKPNELLGDEHRVVSVSSLAHCVAGWALTVAASRTSFILAHADATAAFEAEHAIICTRASAELYAGLFACRVSVYFAQLTVMQTRGYEERRRMEIRAKEHTEAIVIKRLMSQGKWQAIEQSQRRSHEEGAFKQWAFFVAQQEEIQRVRLMQRRTKSINGLVQDFWARTRPDQVTLIATVGAPLAALVDHILVVIANGLPIDSNTGEPLMCPVEDSRWHAALRTLGLRATSSIDAIAAPPADPSDALLLYPTGSASASGAGGGLSSATPLSRFSRSTRGSAINASMRLGSGTDGATPTTVVNAPYLPGTTTIRALASRSLLRLPWPSPQDDDCRCHEEPGTACLAVVVPQPIPPALTVKVSGFVTSLRSGNMRLPKQAMPPRTPLSSKAAMAKRSITSPGSLLAPSTPASSSGRADKNAAGGSAPFVGTPKQTRLNSPPALQPTSPSTSEQPSASMTPSAAMDNFAKMDLTSIFIDSSGIQGGLSDDDDDDTGTTATEVPPAATPETDFRPGYAMSLITSCLVVPSFFGPHLTAAHVMEDAVAFAEACRAGQELIERENQRSAVERIAANHRATVYAKVQAAKDAYIAAVEREELLKKQRAASRSKGATSQAWKQQHHTPSPALTSVTSKGDSDDATPQQAKLQMMPASRAASAASSKQRLSPARRGSPSPSASRPSSRGASPSPSNATATAALASSQTSAAIPVSTPRALVELGSITQHYYSSSPPRGEQAVASQGSASGEPRPEDFAAIVAMLRRPVSPARNAQHALPDDRSSTLLTLNSTALRHAAGGLKRPSSALSQRSTTQRGVTHRGSSRTPELRGPSLSANAELLAAESRQKVAVRYEVLARQPDAVFALSDAVSAQQQARVHQSLSRADQLHLKSVAHVKRR